MTLANGVLNASRSFQQRERRDPNRTIRYTIDMDREQHRFLKLFAVHNDVSASVIMRSLGYLLETRLDLATLVMDTIYLGASANKARKTIRYTIDMEGSQHTFFRLFAAHNETRVSTIVRTLLYLLETRMDLATMVIETIFIETYGDDDEGEDVVEEVDDDTPEIEDQLELQLELELERCNPDKEPEDDDFPN